MTFYKQPTIQYNGKRVHEHYIEMFQIGADFGKENNSKKMGKKIKNIQQQVFASGHSPNY